ncbi:HlyD family type I secretion periplasmic adaptor subunit [Microvirga sp. 17 mud 1-3]|uniref:HlyD family type I secretion periplasmic adaptor subunit n=1 Tax=Microvirga sp. 17 mud 1-3 TaxID=2082949 RepID=UPI000D6CE48E|nr:HlyD family type I secretion periplasmic adaptor subunit [Microvirga sp. 17 mud 1-3]AWM86124.1 HlyD family type I secretion periplasmic adaptor subunit [Microvirga sp. 17 mud 1-3]
MSHTATITLQKQQEWYADVPRSTRLPTLLGIAILTLTLMGFGYWGGIAPIAGAVVTSGAFVATGQNKIIQHLEGGVIQDILVREGDVVEPGETLIQLDETGPRAELRRLALREARLIAIEARLRAEMAEKREVAFPDELLRQVDSDPDIATIVKAQRATIEARQKSLQSEIASIRTSIEALHERIKGSTTQLASVREQIAFFDEELLAKEQLLKSGLIRKSEVLALQRARANLQGEVGRLTGEIGDSKERIARSEEQIVGTRNAAIKTSVEQLHETLGELADVRERVLAATRVLDRVKIASPVKGVVVKLRYHTPGGVIEAGKTVMEIVPLQDSLLIEVRVRPQDIPNVKLGQKAIIRLTALKQRITPMIEGEVVYVSADALPDEKSTLTRNDVYVARVSLDPNEASKIHGFAPTPGMPAEVYIKTTDRTFIEYLLQPIRDSMARAFREM